MEEKVFRYNRKAVYFLNQNDFNSSFTYLNKAQRQLKGVSINSCAKLMGITLNNFGCYYKTTGQPQQALMYLNQAIEVEKTNMTDINNLAATHLNVCAIESQIGNHIKALDNCLKAIHLLKAIYKSTLNLTTIYVTAHYNAGIEYRFLQKPIESKKIFEIAFNISKEYLGFRHFLTIKLEEILNSTSGQSYTGTSIKSPTKTIRSSTASTTFKRKFRNDLHSDLEKFSDAFSSNFSKYTHSVVSPVSINRRFRDTTPNKSSFAPAFKMTTKKVKIKKPKKTKKNIKSLTSEKSIQADLRNPPKIQNLRIESAIKIQTYWRMFLAKKKFQIMKLNSQIEKTEELSRKTNEKLIKLHKQRDKLQGKTFSDFKELIPIPYKDKLEKKIISTRSLSTEKKILKTHSYRASTSTIENLIKLQAAIRKYIYSQKYKKTYEKIVKIQKYYRSYLVRKKTSENIGKNINLKKLT
ncbi:hypothetical protein SteCoe_31432 [Stentor coeruleus]|uniref:Uncharacterized protein n=1 Tax=Stentor coeruleus TaxID=5963 RepID=A0A1R2B1I3_9CILI|nr:hypothetical protein SteCoe_31432 [Stentor coeruleus]